MTGLYNVYMGNDTKKNKRGQDMKEKFYGLHHYDIFQVQKKKYLVSMQRV